MRLEPLGAMRTLIVVLAVFVATTSAAEKRGTIRVGVLPLALESSASTPLFGAHVQDAVDDFNRAAAARGMSARVAASDLGIETTMVSIAPGIEVGGRRYMFRIEGVIGRAGDLTALGVGIYPIGIQGKVGRKVALVASAGGVATWLDRSGSGDIGGLVLARLAFGARVADRVLFEVGYNPFVLGGNVNQRKLDEMRDGTAMPAPGDAISAGEARALLDVSVGLTF